jgi:membrane-associated phospholipid phosphatase
MLPYVIPAGIMVLAQFASAVINFFAPAGVLVGYTTIMILAAAETILYMIARKAKSKIFGFPSAHSTISATDAIARSWITCTQGFSYILDERPEENY